MSNIPSFSDLETDDFSLDFISSLQGVERFALDNESEGRTGLKPLRYHEDDDNFFSKTSTKHPEKNQERIPKSGDIYTDADDKTTESFNTQVDVDEASEMTVAKDKQEVHLKVDDVAGTTPPLEVQADHGKTEADCMIPLLDEFAALTVSESDDTGSNGESEIDCWDELEIADEDGDTLLHQAIILNNTDLTSLILRIMSQSGLGLNSRNLLFQTALHLAVLTDQIGIVEELVENGADIMVRDKNGRTPVHIACEMQRPDLVNCLLTHVVRDSFGQCRPKTKPKSVLDIKNYNGEACVHIAAKCSDVNLMKCLIKHGANGNLADEKSGRTALHFAAESNNISMVTFLLGVNGINASPETLSEESPILLAYLRDFDEVVELFQQKRNT